MMFEHQISQSMSLVQIFVILAARISTSEAEVGVSVQYVSYGNVEPQLAGSLAQRLSTSISSPLCRAQNIKGAAAKTSSRGDVISGTGDSNLLRKRSSLDLRNNRNVLNNDEERISTCDNDKKAFVLLKFIVSIDRGGGGTKLEEKEWFSFVLMRKEQFCSNDNSRSLIFNRRLHAMFKKYFKNKLADKDQLHGVTDDDLLANIEKNDVEYNKDVFDNILKYSFLSDKRATFKPIASRRKRFLREDDTTNQQEESPFVKNQNRVKKHVWHFMGPNFWSYGPQSYVIYNGVPTIIVQFPPTGQTVTAHWAPYKSETYEYLNKDVEKSQGFVRDSSLSRKLGQNNIDDWYSDYDDYTYDDISKLSDDQRYVPKLPSDSNDKKLLFERLKMGGLSTMLDYKKNMYKKDSPLSHMRMHLYPPWPERNLSMRKKTQN